MMLKFWYKYQFRKQTRMQLFPDSVQSFPFHRVPEYSRFNVRISASDGISCDSRHAQDYDKIDTIYKSALTA
jgi:hypothetical protein